MCECVDFIELVGRALSLQFDDPNYAVARTIRIGKNGPILYKIQKILGHKRIHSTLMYIKAAITELKSCVNPLGKIYEDSGARP